MTGIYSVYVCAHAYVYICMCMYTCIRGYMHVHVHMHKWIYACAWAHVNMYMRTYTYTYIYTYMSILKSVCLSFYAYLFILKSISTSFQETLLPGTYSTVPQSDNTLDLETLSPSSSDPPGPSHTTVPDMSSVVSHQAMYDPSPSTSYSRCTTDALSPSSHVPTPPPPPSPKIRKGRKRSLS